MSTPAPDDRPADSPVDGAADPLGGRPAGVPAGTPYHRLAHLREAWARPARPVLTVLVAIIAYVVLASILLVAIVTSLALLPGDQPDLGMHLRDPSSPLDVGVSLAMGALWCPAALIGARFGGWRPTRWLLSVTGTFRGELVRAAALPVGAAALLGTVVMTGIVWASRPWLGADSVGAGQALFAAALALVLGLAKAIGVELALRGMLLQALGTWLRSPALTIVFATIVSLAVSGFSRTGIVLALTMGLACGYLAWRSGGLELPILLTASLTISGGVVAALNRIAEPAIRDLLGLDGVQLSIGWAGYRTGETTSAAAAIPGVASGSILGAIGIGLLALIIAALLGRWIGRREQLAAAEPVRRPADAPAPEPVAV
ncbi:CAAX protease [Brachybacterium phenoliresistens]|uniref:CAAX protease n=1 Tax=Brachybacterium phenoliresistens TaxID=396014 RepID=Z9JVL1_9MICO|nr:CPBP family intramembrane glutamic endopeptidase [Brachybacterium phenoliresistens]EWS81822.1 CAAX protease [Brachybacterium phenoliresistens]